MTNEVLAVLRNIPSLRHASPNLLIALVAIAAVLGFALIFLFIFVITDMVSTEQKEHKLPDSHKVIVDLQKTLINEMKGTSKQNALMINLTIIFILVTIMGTVVSVLGPEKTGNLIHQLIANITGLVSKASGTGKGIKVK